MVADLVDFKVAMLNQKEAVEPWTAPPAYQRQSPPDLVPAELPARGAIATVMDEPPAAPPPAPKRRARRSLLPRRPRRR